MTRAGIAGTVAAVVAAAVLATPAWASGLQRGGENRTRLVPALGDWEGTTHGLPVSFAVHRVPRFATQYHTAPYGFTDLVIDRPCQGAGQTGFTGAGWGTLGPILENGAFDERRYPVRITTSRTGAMTLHTRCDGRVTWRLRPVHRAPVSDGVWTLHYGDGESAPFTVTAGGRVSSSLVGPASALAACGYLGAGGGSFFITAGGALTFSNPAESLVLALHFAGPRATGAVTFSGPQCGPTRLVLSAQRDHQG